MQRSYSTSYEAHLKNKNKNKQRVVCAKKEKYTGTLQNVISFHKSQKLLTEHCYEKQPIQNI